MSTARLGNDSDTYLQTLIGGFARDAVVRSQTPTELLWWRRTFNRIENADLTASITLAAPDVASVPVTAPSETDVQVVRDRIDLEPAPTTADEAAVVAGAEAYLDVLEHVRTVLGLADLTDESLRQLVEQATSPRTDPRAIEDIARRIEQQEERIEELETELGLVRLDLDNEQDDHLDTRFELEKQTDRAAWLGKQLAESAGRPQDAYAPVPDGQATVYPDTFDELLDWAERLPGIILTADRGLARQLTRVDTNDKALRTAWDACLALSDYAGARKAGDTTGPVHDYLTRTPAGYRGITPGKHAWTETGATLKQFGDERVLPVPTEVDPAGMALMKTHFKLARIGTVSPRMYYLDDIANTGTIYVGYIGPHMTNTQTN